MENELRNLCSLGNEANRANFAKQWKKEGKKVVGILCSYVPEEIIHAAGMLPWRIFGTWRASTPLADEWRRPHMCLYCNHVLESLLSGELDFLDAVVATDWDQELVRLWDVWKYIGETPSTFIIDVPIVNSGNAVRYFAKQVEVLYQGIEKMAGHRVLEESLRHSIAVYEKTRSLIRHLYELRKAEVPPLSGTELLGITTSALLMPKEEFNSQLEALLPYIEQRKIKLNKNRPRLLVSSDRLDNPEYLKVVEESGCLVAMDDLDTGSRHFWCHVDTASVGPLSTREELITRLASRYLMQPASPRMMNWQEQVWQVAEWVREFNIQGVLELSQGYSRYREFRTHFFKHSLETQGIPMMSFRREYHLAHVGQLKTRVGAFVEILEARR
jgi:benzoyl-CoA reductase subunit C